MASWNGNIFLITGSLSREFTSHQLISFTKANGMELWCFLCSAPWINGWVVNNNEAGDLRCHRAHYYVIVMYQCLHKHIMLECVNRKMIYMDFFSAKWQSNMIQYKYNMALHVAEYCLSSSIRHNKSQNLNVSCLVLQLSLPNPLKPGAQSRMKM